MRRVGVPLADEIDHHLLGARVQRIDLVVGSEHLLGSVAVGVRKALERRLHHVGDLAGGRGDLGLDRGGDLMGNLSRQIRHVTRLGINVRQVAHQAK